MICTMNIVQPPMLQTTDELKTSYSASSSRGAILYLHSEAAAEVYQLSLTLNICRYHLSAKVQSAARARPINAYIDQL